MNINSKRLSNDAVVFLWRPNFNNFAPTLLLKKFGKKYGKTMSTLVVFLKFRKNYKKEANFVMCIFLKKIQTKNATPFEKIEEVP